MGATHDEDQVLGPRLLDGQTDRVSSAAEAPPGGVPRVKHADRTVGQPTHLRTDEEDVKARVWRTDESADACAVSSTDLN